MQVIFCSAQELLQRKRNRPNHCGDTHLIISMTLGISCACGAPNPTNDTYQPNWCNFLTMASATQTQTGNKERAGHPELRNMQMIKLISRPPSNHWNLTTPERWTLIIDPATVIVYDRRSSDLEHHLFTVASPLSKYRSICGRSKYRSWRFTRNFYSRRTLSTNNIIGVKFVTLLFNRNAVQPKWTTTWGLRTRSLILSKNGYCSPPWIINQKYRSKCCFWVGGLSEFTVEIRLTRRMGRSRLNGYLEWTSVWYW